MPRAWGGKSPKPECNSFTSYGMGSSEAEAMFLRGIGQSDHMVTTDPRVGLYIDRRPDTYATLVAP